MFFKGLAVFFEIEAEGTAQDDMVGADVGDDRSKTGGHATGDLDPVGFFLDFGSELAVVIGDGFGGREVFPCEKFASKNVLIMAGFKSVKCGIDVAITDDGTANTGGES